MTLLLNIDVPDVETALRFYTTAFDLKVGRRFGADFVELLGWPATVYLLTKAAGTIGAGGDPRRYNRHWTPVHPDIVVDDEATDLHLWRSLQNAAGSIVLNLFVHRCLLLHLLLGWNGKASQRLVSATLARKP